MALAGELAKYIGGGLVKNTGKELATNATTSALSNLAPKIATKAGASMANKIGNEMIAGSVLDKLIPTNRMLDKNGRPVTLYHSTPNNFDKFDDAMLGSNTGYDNTALGHFVTPDKDFSKRFIDIDNVGKTGRTMELQGNIQKPITHPYMAGYKYDNKDLDKIVEDYLLATDNPEFLDELRGYALDDNSNLYDEYMGLTMADSPFEVSGSDRQSLMNKGYDAVEIVEGPKSGLVEGSKDNTPVSSYAVFNGENLRPVRHIPINQISNTKEVPVSTLRKLFRGQKKGSDDLYYNKGDGTTGSATVGNGYYMTPNADKAEVWAGEGINPISIEANTKDILSKNELIEKTKWANDLINDEAYMSELWGKDPDMADFIENLSMGRLPEISKYLDKPFIQPDSGQGEELAETIFFPDTRPELTRKIRDGLKASGSHAVMYEKNGRSLTEMANRIKAMNKAQDLDSGIKRIGNSEVAEIDANTLPAGYEKVKKYLGSSDAERIEEYTGANLENDSIEEYTNKLKKFLEEEGYDSDKTGAELLRDVRAVINEKMTEDLGMEGSTLYKEFFQTRGRLQKDNPLTGVGPSSFTISADKDKLYQTDAAKLDAEYSERLGIGRSHIPMSDKALSRDAQGYYMGGGIGINPRYASGESGVSTIAHERMHGWQDINKGEWDSRVGDAIDELRNELKKHYHTKAEIKAYRKSGSDLDYYANQNEQEARMLQSYLDNEGFTKTWRKQAGEPTEWGDEIKPAFDKFYKKLRALSKAGVALPGIAVLFGLSSNGGEKKEKTY